MSDQIGYLECAWFWTDCEYKFEVTTADPVVWLTEEHARTMGCGIMHVGDTLKITYQRDYIIYKVREWDRENKRYLLVWPD